MKKPLFIHIPKSGGMTIRKHPDRIVETAINFMSSDYQDMIIDHMKKLGDHHGLEHARFRDLAECYQDEIRTGKRKAVAVIRNPWSRTLSRFMFARKVIEVEQKVPRSYADISSFENFIKNEYEKWGTAPHMHHRAVRGWYPCADYVTDPTSGNIVVDCLPFEDYDRSVMQYFALLSPARARNVTAMTDKSYQSFYTDELIELVEEIYKADIEAFGYEFGTGPKQNYWKI